MKYLKYLFIAAITLLYSCSDQNGEGGIAENPCDINEQGFHITENGNNAGDLHFDDTRTIVEYVTGHPQGDYYHIYSNQGAPFFDFYTFAVTSGSTSTLDQNWNTTAGSYLTMNGIQLPQTNNIVINTTVGSNQVGGNIKLEMTGTYDDGNSNNIPFSAEMCVTIDAIVDLADYAYITDGTNLKIIDVSNPLAPSIAHSIPANTAYYVNVLSGVAYVGYFDATAPFASFVNVANPPTAYIFEDIAKGSNYRRLSDVSKVDNLVYITDEYRGIHKLDIANSNYTRVDIHDAMSITLKGNDFYIIDFAAGIHKYDVTDPYNPIITNVFNLVETDIASYPHSTASFHSWTRTDGNDIYVANIIDKKLKRFNASDLFATSEVIIDGYATAFEISGNFAFITMKPSTDAPLQSSYDGIKMVDLSTMTVVDSKPLSSTSGVAVSANYVYVTDANGLHIYDFSSSTLSLVNTYAPGNGNYISL